MFKNVKKSLVAIGAAFCMLLTAGVALLVKQPAETVSAATETVSYNADFSNGVPSDWRLYARSATTSAVEDTPGDSVLTAGNTDRYPGGNKYYGTVYRAAQTMGEVSDFTLEMKFKVKANAEDDGGWIGLLYRTKTTWHGKLTGYGMSYRPIQGRSYEVAPSFVSEDDYQSETAVVFNDGTSLYTYTDGSAIPKVKSGDGVEHSMKVVVSGTTAWHYIDGALVEEISLADDPNDATDVFSRLGGYHASGGFDLVIAGLTLDITSYTITNAVRDAATESYVADFSDFNYEGLPDDWTLDEYADIDSTTITPNVENKHVNVSAGTGDYDCLHSRYYSSKIDLNIGHYSDFVFEMSFKLTYTPNPSRWLGVMYHTQTDENGRSQGFLQGYRMSAEFQSSVITSTSSGASFADFNAVTAAVATGRNLDTIDVGETHTLRIWANGDRVFSYMDDRNLSDFSIAEKQPEWTEGGFSILVNKSAIDITRVVVSGTQTKSPEEAPLVTDLEFAPTVVLDVDSAADLQAVANGKAESAILTIDKNLNVLAADQSVITTLPNALSTLNTASTLPIVRINGNKDNTVNKDVKCNDSDISDGVAIEDRLYAYLNNDHKAVADAFIEYITTNALTDISVLSNDKVLLYYIRRGGTRSLESTPYGRQIRGILDWTAHDLTKADWQYVLQTTNMSWAHVALLNQESATRDAVEFLQGRLKTVWVEQSADTQFNVVELVSSGCYGIVTDNANTVHSAYRLYEKDLKSLVRAPMNIAHRGVSYATENSLYGYQCAYADGAVYFEIDTYLTRDKHVVLMHNQTIDATTTCDIAGQYVKDMSYAELSQYRIDTTVDGQKIAQTQPIPKLEDLFNYFWDKDIVYAFEIKDSNTEIVYRIRDLIEAHDAKYKGREGYVSIWDQIFFITFQTESNPNNPGKILETLRDVIPEIPSAYLNDTSSEECSRLNCVKDVSGGSRALTENSKLRGYMSYCWTYYTWNTDDAYTYYGSYGITTNYAETLTKNARHLNPSASGGYISGVEDLASYPMYFESENRVTHALTPATNAVLHATESGDGYVKAVYKAVANTYVEKHAYTLYSESIPFWQVSVVNDGAKGTVSGVESGKYYQNGTALDLSLAATAENSRIKSYTLNGETINVGEKTATVSLNVSSVTSLSV
ncbi:MAG: hypothetical protein IJV80_06355 [Clostridia bacterium]|nr:hypothetical protein [Clostridia bacterium]